MHIFVNTINMNIDKNVYTECVFFSPEAVVSTHNWLKTNQVINSINSWRCETKQKLTLLRTNMKKMYVWLGEFVNNLNYCKFLKIGELLSSIRPMMCCLSISYVQLWVYECWLRTVFINMRRYMYVLCVFVYLYNCVCWLYFVWRHQTKWL